MAQLRIRFDLAFDGTVWPGAARASGTGAVFGEAWFGPQGLLHHLETTLGLGGPYLTNAERTASLIPVLRDTGGYWSSSLDADPYGVANRILSDRDELWMHGWRGEDVSDGLSQLARCTKDVPLGVPDRLARVADTLKTRGSEAHTLQLVEPTDELPLVWRQVLQGLSAKGTAVEVEPLPPADAGGDLAAARADGFEPAADGTLQLVRPYGPLAAAEDISAWLAAEPNSSDTVIIGGDLLLDQALSRHGLPTTGVGAAENSLLSVLPLVIDLGWDPQDPQRVYELLLIPDGPVSAHIARRLVAALQRWPAVDSDLWREKLAEGLAEIANLERRKRIEDRLNIIFSRQVARGKPYPMEEIERRIKCVEDWAQGHLGSDSSNLEPWYSVLDQAQTLNCLLNLARLRSLTAAEVGRWIQLASRSATSKSPLGAQAGLASVRRPDAIAGRAARIVWWDFNQANAPLPKKLPLSSSERNALASKGIELPAPGTLAVAVARRWRRPLAQAAEALLLVCPRRAENGDELYPHPLWDEIEARATAREGQSTARMLVRSKPDLPTAVPQTLCNLRPIAKPTRFWKNGTAGTLKRPVESPSSIQSFLGCSLQWTLRYFGHLNSTLGEPPPTAGPLLNGSLAHAILSKLVSKPGTNPEAATLEAERLFDELAPRLAAPLFLPGREAERGDFRNHLARTARTLTTLLQESGATVQSSEERYSESALGTTMRGFPDLILSNPNAVVDFKWASRSRHQDALLAGTALQLIAYAYLTKSSADEWPGIAYLIVRGGEFLTNCEGFPGGIRLNCPDPATSWSALEAAYGRRQAELKDGLLTAPANPGEGTEATPDETSMVNGVLKVEPPCVFCRYDLICGAALKEEV